MNSTVRLSITTSTKHPLSLLSSIPSQTPKSQIKVPKFHCIIESKYQNSIESMNLSNADLVYSSTDE